MTKPFLLLMVSILSGVCGQLALKSGMSQVGSLLNQPALQPLQMIVRVMTTPLVLIGLLCYGLGAAAWLVVLSRFNLSYAYPFLAVNFVLITLASRFFLGEAIPPLRWMGVLVICAGVILVFRS